MRGLSDKVAIVTGGGSGGSGAGISLRLAEEGAKVAIFDLNPAAGEEVAALAGPGATVKTYQVDVSDYAARGGRGLLPSRPISARSGCWSIMLAGTSRWPS